MRILCALNVRCCARRFTSGEVVLLPRGDAQQARSRFAVLLNGVAVGGAGVVQNLFMPRMSPIIDVSATPATREYRDNEDIAGRGNRSKLAQPVALTFATPEAERERAAAPILRLLRQCVGEGEALLPALVSLDGNLIHREFARWALNREVHALSLGLSLLEVSERHDVELNIWLVSRALRRCERRPVVARRGGWRVTH